jgi:tetratricopeptide (TPR) repeat protein
MKLLSGETLAAHIKERGPLTLVEATPIIFQVADALTAAHEAGILHRDIKAANVMLGDSSGRVHACVMDFGLARAYRSESTVLTADGVPGTPGYVAPELFQGVPPSTASDVYAFGVMVYHMLTGHLPAVRLSPKTRPVRDPLFEKLPRNWRAMIERCIEPDVGRRYSSFSEVTEGLQSSQFVLRRFQRTALSRHRVVGVCALLVILLTTAGWFSSRAKSYKPPSSDVARWYDLGMTALREGSYLKATRALSMATKADKNFTLAHAGLAEAWEELDFTGAAEREMLFAAGPDQQRDLPELDRKYIDAVRTTLIRDYSSAAQDYESILKQLPEERKAQGYVDLGRAYEKAGRFRETIDSYEKAAQLSPDDPAPFLHLGILKSRRRDAAGAKAAFDKAEALYAADSNFEGTAEVDYQRGYAANDAGFSDEAKTFLNKSLIIARQIPSVQLEVRSLSQLSSVDYNDSHDDAAIEEANQAIKLAEDNGLEYWATDGLVRLGNAYMDKEDFAKAEPLLQQALRQATQNQHPRLEASSQMSLSSIRDQQHRWDEEVAFAQSALKYYQDFGFMDSAAAASTLIVRGELGKGDIVHAQQRGGELLQVAARADSKLSLESAEELVGGISLEVEQYPAALIHYESALKIARSLHVNEAYQALHCVDTLSHLGQYAEAETMLAAIAPDARKRTDIGSRIELIRATMQLSRGQYRDALATSRAALSKFHDAGDEKVAELDRVEALAEAKLGQTEPAHRDADSMMASARKATDERLVADAELVEAEVALQSHSPAAAIPTAEAAQQYFAGKGEKESEWLSLLDEAEAMNASGNGKGGAEKAGHALDIVKEIEQSWETSIFYTYSNRPDIQLALHRLAKLRLT